METLVEQPTHERKKSYEPLASANMLRYDLENFGAIQPETRSRVGDEELSYLAEGINKASKTSFILERKNGDIVYFDEGQWKSYKGLLYTGLETAREEAAVDPRREFLVTNASDDLVNGNIMCGLKPGEQHVWWSSYEYEIERKYGTGFMEECGRHPDRQMGFLYRAFCQDDGTILLESQTIDQSDAEGFKAVQDYAENHDPNIDELVDVYDEVLYAKDGIKRYAGRPEAERQENAWDDIHRHRDLIEYHLNTLEDIAAGPLTGRAFEIEVKKHTYGVWAAFKKRIESRVRAHYVKHSSYASHLHDPHLHAMLEQETKTAFNEFATQGKVMVGCGGGFTMVVGEQNILSTRGSDVHSSIFSGGDKHGSLTFTCPNGHRNRRKHGELLKKCQHDGCKAKVACK